MKTVLLFLFFLAGACLSAQTDKKSSASDTTSLSVQNDLLIQSRKTFSKSDAPTPSPEEQGFTKQIIDGKAVYRKEQGQIMIEYIPN